MANVDEKTIFDTLSKINVSKLTKERNGFNYLPWSQAYELMMKNYPDLEYEVEMFDGKPFLYDEVLGYMVFTKVTIGGKTRKMQLSVMDGANRALKAIPQVIEKKGKNGQPYTQEIAACTMNDINKAIMRCLTKNFAMFGLGLHVYEGEDVPKAEIEEMEKKQAELDEASRRAADELNACTSNTDVVEIWDKYPQLQDVWGFKQQVVMMQIKFAESLKELTDIWTSHPEYQADANFKAYMTQRKNALKDE